MGNRSAIIHQGEDNQQVHSFLAPLMDQLLMVLQAEVAPCHSFILVSTQSFPSPWAHKGTDICMCCVCRCESSAVTQEAEEENYSFLVACEQESTPNKILMQVTGQFRGIWHFTL